MPDGIPMEALLTASYAGFLVVVALVLERLAKHARRRTERLELTGFSYHHDMDRWECPAGSHLIRIHAKVPSRQLRYRAPAHACNSCSMKQGCTDSDQGREIEHHLDLWFQTGLNHFHHGISLTLLLLSAILLAVEAIRFREPGTLLMIGGLFAPVAFLSIRRFTEFRAGRGDQEMHSNPSR